MLDQRLLTILACPIDKGPLLYFPEDECLFNPRLNVRYGVEGGIPVLLAQSAEKVAGEHARGLLARAELDGAVVTAGASLPEVLAVTER